MLRLGVKLTHDGGLALLDGPTLVFSHEAEKSANLPRHSPLSALDVDATLAHYGHALDAIDRVLVDGWIDGSADGVRVAPYHENDDDRDPLRPHELSGLKLGGSTLNYLSFTHAAGHVFGTYATSPFAARGERSLVLVWDGAMLPRLYLVDPAGPECRPLRQLFGLQGHVYPVFGSYFGPFVPDGRRPPAHESLPTQALLSLSGKVMAWAGLGTVDEQFVEELERIYKDRLELRYEFLFAFARLAWERAQERGVPDADAVASLQAWIGRRMRGALARILARDRSLPARLCFTGGCALNIVWNAELRDSGLFEDVWVPPFPNDAGSALGCAAADLVRCGEGPAIDWDVYRGPQLMATEPLAGWSRSPCAIAQLAAFLHETGEPVVFLAGRAELGPRALGNRSILCSATSPQAKDVLNEMKGREWYRPVAPICLEDEAPRVFAPGTPDPYMLFTHAVRPAWRERVPAIVHVDGSARLQTVNAQQNPLVAQLLAEYRERSGIPLLCNTSANLKGSGFFPDLRSAMEWPGARHVWCDGELHSRAPVAAVA
jgi:carbamoyltransferase